MKYKAMVLFIVLGVMVNRGVSAQGYPVIDITAIVAAIENGYTMVQQLQTMYETLKTSYDQLQNQIKNYESLDFSALNAKDPLNSWKSLTTYADRIMTYELNIESIINKKDIKVGNGSYSLSDIFRPSAQTVESLMAEGMNYIIDPLESRLSLAEKALFQQKYGMSFGYFTRISHMREMLKKKAAEVMGYSGYLQQNLAEDRERLTAITKDLFDSGSTIQQQQINNAVLSIMAQDIKTQANILGDIAAQFAAVSAQLQMEKQAIQDELNINSLGIADGFMKMLEEMPPESAYR
jgi:conjugal transfer/entry exclusion protein